MSLSTLLTDLDAARVRFKNLLAGKSITVGTGTTITDCLDLLAEYWDTSAPAVAPGDLDLYLYIANGPNSWTKYRLGSDVDADYTDCSRLYYAPATYAVVSGVLGRIENYGFTALTIANNTGWSKLRNSVSQQCGYAIRSGKLYAVYPSSVVQVGSDSGWTDIGEDVLGLYLAGIRNGQLYLIQGSSAVRISESVGWRLLIGRGDAVADADGKLYQATANGPVLKSELQGWTHLTGFTSNESDHTYHYGICAGKLYRAGTDGSFTQLGISDRWSCIRKFSYSTLGSPAICNGQLYYVLNYSTTLLDPDTGYTDCRGLLDTFEDSNRFGFAICGSRIVMIDLAPNHETLTELTDRAAKIVSGDTNCVFVLEAAASSDSRPATTKLTLTAPDDPDLYAGEDADEHFWSDDDVLTVKVLRGSTVLTTRCTGYNGVEFEEDSLSHLCAGNRVLVDVGSQPQTVASANLTIQWLRGSTVVKTEYRLFDWKHTPQYFTRPAGTGNYSLKIGGSAVSAEVYYGGEWIDFPSGVLSATYAGCSVRTKTAPAQDAIACWSDEGVDGDPFWYLI